MSDSNQRSALLKIKVACKTCGVSESFYSNLSVEKFKARHSGHDVAAGNQHTAPAAARKEKKPAAEERGASMRVSKILVDILSFASLDSPIIRVRGFDVGLDEAFTATMSSAERGKVREMLAAGEYFDKDASGQLYSWEPDAVEYVGEVREKLGLSAEAETEAKTGQPGPESSESEEVIDQATVASAAEVLIDALGADEDSQAAGSAFRAGLLSVSDPSEGLEDVAPICRKNLPSSDLLCLSRAEAGVSSPAAPTSREEERSVERTRDAGAPSGEANDEDYLLVSKSWYIQGGKGNRTEAVRVSKVLKAFRWKVEPIYTIGVILDDMLSIETSRGQISGTLIRRIEGAGYRLTAVAVDQGKPTAWFKKEGPEIRRAHVDSVAASLDDPEIELEQDVTG